MLGGQPLKSDLIWQNDATRKYRLLVDIMERVKDKIVKSTTGFWLAKFVSTKYVQHDDFQTTLDVELVLFNFIAIGWALDASWSEWSLFLPKKHDKDLQIYMGKLSVCLGKYPTARG